MTKHLLLHLIFSGESYGLKNHMFTFLSKFNNALTWSMYNVDKKNQLDVTFCILYFCSNSCSTCFRQPCAHRQHLMMGTCLPETC